jgi:hypothetical protein
LTAATSAAAAATATAATITTTTTADRVTPLVNRANPHSIFRSESKTGSFGSLVLG